MVKHSRILDSLELAKVPENVVEFISISMKDWYSEIMSSVENS